MDIQAVYVAKGRDPRYFPLFERVWNVLCFAPSSQHASEDELISLAWDAFDYLQADGRWQTSATTGRTQMTWGHGELHIHEENQDGFRYDRTFTLQGSTKGASLPR